ncbi:hypothetical protein EUX98_g5289 [Antrodiella citrinella]|uniref:Uncharacterized protein n=1 Tax=Antrodiella citrinella TaxID=2447956 RepID=A0A4S4MRT4_9APHY|nr:hypothetical protein EUX98_g5289 [Antrodiella citrinella]
MTHKDSDACVNVSPSNGCSRPWGKFYSLKRRSGSRFALWTPPDALISSRSPAPSRLVTHLSRELAPTPGIFYAVVSPYVPGVDAFFLSADGDAPRQETETMERGLRRAGTDGGRVQGTEDRDSVDEYDVEKKLKRVWTGSYIRHIPKTQQSNPPNPHFSRCFTNFTPCNPPPLLAAVALLFISAEAAGIGMDPEPGVPSRTTGAGGCIGSEGSGGPALDFPLFTYPDPEPEPDDIGVDVDEGPLPL